MSGFDFTPAPAEFAVIGLNHRTAPVEVREAVSWSDGQLPSLLLEMDCHGLPGVPLSTCNRSEFYFLSSSSADSGLLLRQVLTRQFQVDEESLESISTSIAATTRFNTCSAWPPVWTR